MGKHHADDIHYGWRATKVWTGKRNQLLLETHDTECHRFAELEGLKFSSKAATLDDVRADLICRAHFANATTVHPGDLFVGVHLGGCLTGNTDRPCPTPVGFNIQAGTATFKE
jgi:hypothetical protein